METGPRYAALLMISDCLANGTFAAEDIVSELLDNEVNAEIHEAIQILTHEDFMAAVIDAGLPTTAAVWVDEFPTYESYEEYRAAN